MTNTRAELAPRILSVATAFPPHEARQEEGLAYLRQLWDGKLSAAELRLLEQYFKNVGVRTRRLALPIDAYPALDSFTKRNDLWTRVALELGEDAIRRALAAAGLAPEDVDHIFFVTVTGVATPSIDARLANRLALRGDVKRTPIFGLGCVAGAAGLARAADYLRAFPEHVAVLLSVELCSLTLQLDDRSPANMIASGLFGDGAAAVVLGGGARMDERGPRVLASRSSFYRDTERVMGWEIGERGFKVVLSGDVPAMVLEHVGRDVDGFLAAHALDRRAIHHWVAHTGGPKVLKAFESALELAPDALGRSWRSLERNGNLSSTSVLLVLADLLESGEARQGARGVLLAMGPGFCAELVLLAW